MVTMVLMPSLHPHLSATLFLCLAPRPSTLQEPKDTAVVTTAGSSQLLHYNRGSKATVRVHQLINRPGVVYSQLILLGTGS